MKTARHPVDTVCDVCRSERPCRWHSNGPPWWGGRWLCANCAGQGEAAADLEARARQHLIVRE